MTQRAPIPTFTLFGDAELGLTPAFLHIETIRARSALHDWEISPHRHTQSVQALILRSGTVALTIDGRVDELTGPAFVVIPAGSVHGFRFSPHSVGHVITASVDMAMRARIAGDPMLTLMTRGAHGPVDAGSYDRIERYADELLALAGDSRLDEPLAMALFEVLVRSLPQMAIGDAGEGDAANGGDRRGDDRRGDDRRGDDRRIGTFRRLVEAHLRDHRPMGWFAEQMGVTERTLGRLCQQRLGTTPLGYVQARLTIEAGRLLRYTNGTVAQIAEDMGFIDPSYFARFYKRMTGRSPNVDR